MKRSDASVQKKKRSPVLKILLIIFIIIAALIGAVSAYVPIVDAGMKSRYVSEFQTEIEPFDGQVRFDTVSEQVEAMDLDTDVTVRKLFVDGIALYECFKDDGTKKPVIIVMPNGGGVKEDYVGEAAWYASMGYYAMAIDPVGDGETETHISFWQGTNEQQVYDLNTLIEYYNGVKQANAADFILTGSSMGGIYCYYYGEYGKYKPYAIMPIGGRVHRDTILNFHPERFLDIYILSGMGEEDTERTASVRDFESKLNVLGAQKAFFRYYEGKGHEDILPEYYEERDNFLRAHLSERQQ